MMFHYLSHLNRITVKLQHSALDAFEAHKMIHELQYRRFMAVDSNFLYNLTIYHEAERLAEKIGMSPKKSRLFQC